MYWMKTDMEKNNMYVHRDCIEGWHKEWIFLTSRPAIWVLFRINKRFTMFLQTLNHNKGVKI